MHQCNPERFGFAGEAAADPETIGQISAMDNVFGYVTDHDIRFETRVRQFVPENRRFFICNGSLALTGAFIGCNGITTAFSIIWPEALHKILTLGMAGEYEGARALQRSVQDIDAVMLPYQAAGMKAALNLMGLKGTQPRRPMPPMPKRKWSACASSCSAPACSTSEELAMSESSLQDHDRAFLRAETDAFLPDRVFDAHTHLWQGKNTPWRIPGAPADVGYPEYCDLIGDLHPDRRHAALFIPSVQPDGAGSFEEPNAWIARATAQAPTAAACFCAADRRSGVGAPRGASARRTRPQVLSHAGPNAADLGS